MILTDADAIRWFVGVSGRVRSLSWPNESKHRHGMAMIMIPAGMKLQCQVLQKI